jgi:hypothetical protein
MQSTGSNKKYYAVFNGAFRTRVPEDTEDAIPRINKNKVQVFEREVKALFGFIEEVALEDSDFGKQLKITLDKNDDGVNPILSFGVESKDGRDVLKKLPAVDFTKEVRIMPYRFTPEDKQEEISGISITQKDEEGKYTVKVENFFFDPETKKYIHGYPVIDWDKASESEQKIYKIQRDEFLVNYLKENILPRFSEKLVQFPTRAVEPTYPDEEIDVSSIPF